MVPYGCLENFIDQIAHRSNHGNNTRGFCVRDVNLNLQVYIENETLTTLGFDLAELRIQIMCLGDRLRPVKSENGGGYNFSLVAARINWVFTGSQWFLPNTPVPRPYQ